MPTSLIIAACGALFFIGHLLEAVFRKHRIPDVLPLICLGALVGPGFGFLEPRGVTAVEHVFGHLALIVILFHGGLELRVETLKAHAGAAFKVAAVLILANTLVVACLARVVFHQAWGTGFLLGVILSPLAATVAIPMLEHLPFTPATASILTLESALGDVVAVVGVITLSQVLGGDGSFGSAPFRFAGSLLGAAAVGLGAAVMWSLILRRIRRQAKTTFATEALLLVVAGGLEWAGLSGAIGALAFGIGLRNLDHLPAALVTKLHLDPQGLSQTEMDVLAEAVFILKVFFFFYLGTLLRFGRLDSVLAGILVCLVLLLIRQIFFRKAAPPASAPWEAGLLGWMVPKGLASAVLAGVPAEHGLAGALWIREVAITAIPVSILMTALGVWINRRRIPGP
ncbi:MAG TPA: cation:proton antiporter [Holophagaceae bacterium]